jgi:hypothetical protein
MISCNRGTNGGEGEAVLGELERTLALIEVELGPPSAWRLRQLAVAIELYGYRQFELAYAQARRAQLPLAQIPEAERSATSPSSLGALRHEIRKLRGPTPMSARAA